MREPSHPLFWSPASTPYARGHTVILLEECIANYNATMSGSSKHNHHQHLHHRAKCTPAIKDHHHEEHSDSVVAVSPSDNAATGLPVAPVAIASANAPMPTTARVLCGCRYEYEAVSYQNCLHPKQCQWLSWLLFVRHSSVRVHEEAMSSILTTIAIVIVIGIVLGSRLDAQGRDLAAGFCHSRATGAGAAIVSVDGVQHHVAVQLLHPVSVYHDATP